MLNRPRFIAFHVELERLAEFILRPHCNELGAGHVSGIVGDRPATLAPDGRPFPPADFRVDQHPPPVMFDFRFAGNVDDHDPFQPSHLRRGETDTARSGPHRFFQIADETPERLIEMFYRFGNLFQPRIGINQYIKNSHAPYPISVSIGSSWVSNPFSRASFWSASSRTWIPCSATPSMVMT